MLNICRRQSVGKDTRLRNKFRLVLNYIPENIDIIRGIIHDITTINRVQGCPPHWPRIHQFVVLWVAKALHMCRCIACILELGGFQDVEDRSSIEPESLFMVQARKAIIPIPRYCDMWLLEFLQACTCVNFISGTCCFKNELGIPTPCL